VSDVDFASAITDLRTSQLELELMEPAAVPEVTETAEATAEAVVPSGDGSGWRPSFLDS